MPDEFEDFVQDFLETAETPSVERQAEVSERVGLVPEKVKTSRFKDQLFAEIQKNRDTIAAATIEAGPLAATGQFIPAGLVLAGTLAFPPETPAQARGQVTGGIADLVANRALPGAGAARRVLRALLPGLATAAEQTGEVAAGQATPEQAVSTSAFTGLVPPTASELGAAVLRRLFSGGTDPVLRRVRGRVGSEEQFGAAVETGGRGLRGLSRFSAPFDFSNQKFSSDVRLHNLATETIQKFGLEFEPGPEGMRNLREGLLGRLNRARDFGEGKKPSGEAIKRAIQGQDIVAVSSQTGSVMTLNKGGSPPPGFKLVQFDQLGLDQLRSVMKADPGIIARKIGPQDQNFFAVRELKKVATEREWELFRKQWASEHILRTSLIDSALDVPSDIRGRLSNERIVLDAKKLQKNIKETVGTQMAKEVLGTETVEALEDVGDLLVHNSVDLTGKGPAPIPQFVSYGFNKVAFASAIGGLGGFSTGATAPVGAGVVVGLGALISYLIDNPKISKLMTEAAGGNKGALNAVTRTLLTSDYFLPTGPPNENNIVQLEESPRGLDGPEPRLRDQRGRFKTRSLVDVLRNR